MKFLKSELDADLRRLLVDRKQVSELLLKGKTLAEIAEIEPEEVQAMDQHGRLLLQQEKFEDAYAVFTFLATVSPFVESHWMGLGIAAQHVQAWSEALSAFCVTLMLRPNDPCCWLYAAQCELALGRGQEAWRMLKEAEHLAHKEPDIQAQVAALLDVLRE